MGHLDSQRSLPAIGPDKLGLSPTAKKLRLGAGQQVAVLNAPDGFLGQLRPGPADVRTELTGGSPYDAVLLFVKDTGELRRLGPPAIHAVKPNGLLWITYPKGGRGGVGTDLPATPSWVQRDVLGEITGETGYKPVSFVALDDVWMALRFKRV